MTKEYLSTYRSKKAEILELKCMIEGLSKDDSMVANDTILDYRSGYPIPKSIVGVDWEKVIRTETRYKNKIAALEQECSDIEDFVESIPDSLLRRIFRMRFIEGWSQSEIGQLLHLDRSRISRKIDDFLQNAHKAQKAHV